VRRLRAALEPEATTLAEIPPFDLALAYELYAALLAPVEDGWRKEKSLIVVTNGALGLLPLSLLPTAPVEIKNEGPDAGPDAGLMFAGYRGVPWLARTHAVTMVPSAAALRTLRALPRGKATRDQLIGFGDPLFSKEQAQARAPIVLADAATTAPTTRGLPLARRSSPRLEGVNSAELAMLPPLPDTAEELRAIAAALGADPAKSLNLGRDANVQRVKSLDLSRFKVVAFATHGLIPGELDGLTQPALALSAPEVSGTAGDGLLTMGDILALKLDADWVVLSACNTAAGAGEGAEAASGLGRAFFYAGTRAILVTNWSVDSASARALVSDIFRRQTADPTLSRSEALRQAMMSLLDGPGGLDGAGKPLFTYGHPLFWAPYSIIGDSS
jgi:CHAT domain-containing protein